MILGQINFGPAGKFSYDVPAESISNACKNISEFIMKEDEKIIVNYLRRSNKDALLRLKALIEDALKQRTTAAC